MKRQGRGIALLLLLLVFSVSCTAKQESTPPKTPPNSPSKTKLTAEKAIALANAEASKQGFDLDKYNSPKAHYETGSKDKIWTVFYDGKVKMPGHHFLVVVDDETNDCQLMRGK
jgi:hypothetical protein